MGHAQPRTPVHVDKTTCVGIVNNTIKRQRSRAMEMRYFWLLDQTTQQYVKVYYQPGAENMGDYPSKAHTGHIHKHVRPYYVQMSNSPEELPRAAKPSLRRGCVETLGDPYYKRVPLPRVPEYRNLSQDSQLMKPSVKTTTAVEPNTISDYPNGYRRIFGRRRSPITPACE